MINDLCIVKVCQINTRNDRERLRSTLPTVRLEVRNALSLAVSL